MNKVTVYLGDLFYDQRAKFHGVPLNIGYIGNALKVTFGAAVDLELFKYPEELISAINRKRPDILGLSNYAWNQLLALKVAQFSKRVSPETLTVMGGPHIRSDALGMRDFLGKNKEIDCYIPFIGEFPFIELVRGILKNDCGTKIDSIYKALKTADGIFLNVPEYKYRPIDNLSWKEVFKFGSPYLNGLMDKFIADITFMPLFESNRGCPYGCTYCAFGVGSYRKVYLKDKDTVLMEFQYVIDHGAGQKQWYITDANFGIFPRDVEIAESLKAINEKYGYPIIVNGTTGKGPSFKNVIKITEILGNIFEPNIAVQSFDPKVLSNIKRQNLDDETIKKLVGIYTKNGAETSTDIIVGLSGESFQSHISTLKKAMDLNLNFQVATLALLPGTVMDTAQERGKYNFNVKFRFRADTFGVYNDEFIFDIEEVVCGSNTLSFDEFLDMRCIHLLIYMLWTAGIGRRLLKFAEALNGAAPIETVCRIQQKPSSKLLKQLLMDLRKELQKQFFDTKEALMSYYKDRDRINTILKDGNTETKLFWKHFADLLLKKDNVIELIDEVVSILSAYQNINPGLLGLLRKISIEQLMIDFSSHAILSKQIEYEISRDEYLMLLEKGIIPKEVKYKDNKMIVKYSYDKRKYEHYNEILNRFNYKTNPHLAINAALNLNFGANIQYDIC